MRYGAHMESDLREKTVVITGANTGIGKVTAQTLAARGATVVLACRSEAKTAPVIAAIRAAVPNAAVEFVALDLGDLAAIKRAAQQLASRERTIDILINNAGVAGLRGTTKDGFEMAFGTNHLGHYLWTRLLLPHVKRGTGLTAGRIVNVASRAHYSPKHIAWEALRKPTQSRTGLAEYGVSKLCNVLFTQELARREPGINSYAVHPGVIATDVWRHTPAPLGWLLKKFLVTPEQGAQTSIATATAARYANESGRYYHSNGNEKRPNRLALDPSLATELWQRSAVWVGLE